MKQVTGRTAKEALYEGNYLMINDDLLYVQYGFGLVYRYNENADIIESLDLTRLPRTWRTAHINEDFYADVYRVLDELPDMDWKFEVDDVVVYRCEYSKEKLIGVVTGGRRYASQGGIHLYMDDLDKVTLDIKLTTLDNNNKYKEVRAFPESLRRATEEEVTFFEQEVLRSKHFIDEPNTEMKVFCACGNAMSLKVPNEDKEDLYTDEGACTSVGNNFTLWASHDEVHLTCNICSRSLMIGC